MDHPGDLPKESTKNNSSKEPKLVSLACKAHGVQAGQALELMFRTNDPDTDIANRIVLSPAIGLTRLSSLKPFLLHNFRDHLGAIFGSKTIFFLQFNLETCHGHPKVADLAELFHKLLHWIVRVDVVLTAGFESFRHHVDQLP